MLADYDLADLLLGAQTIAMVGLSGNPQRDSFAAARYLQRNNYTVVPVNPNVSGPVLGAQPFARLEDVPVPVDIVAVFRRSEYALEVVEAAIACGAKAVWMPLGVVNEVAAQRARGAGLAVVMDRCIAVEHRRVSRYALAAA